MKIAIDCRMIRMSGIGVYLENILFYLVQDENLNFILVGDKTALLKFEPYSNCSILHCIIPIFSLRELFNFPVAEINKCDIFYSPNYNIPGRVKIPIFSTIHDVVFLDVKGLTSIVGKKIRWLMLYRSIKISRVLFTVSNFSKERILHHFNFSRNVIVAYNGVSESLMNYKYNGNVIFDFDYILYVGNIKKHKGIKILLEAYEDASNNGFEKKLVIVGSYENFKSKDTETIDLITKINSRGSNVIFTGYLSEQKLFDIIYNAELLVQPSLYEGFGIPPLEALYLGVSVLISDIEVFQEIYSALPVIFFNVNNDVDLASKLKHYNSTDMNVMDIRMKIDSTYNYKKTSQIVKAAILSKK